MTRIAFATAVALAALTGVSQAQQSPELIGNYAANVLNDQNGSSLQASAPFTGAAAISGTVRTAPSATSGVPGSLNWNENYSGR